MGCLKSSINGDRRPIKGKVAKTKIRRMAARFCSFNGVSRGGVRGGFWGISGDRATTP